jgi:TonB family protein
MSAAPNTSNIELWASWEGHVINGAYPLQRHLGSSDHSGVFLTEARNTRLAIKIVPAIAEQAELQLARWLTAGDLDHPNLVGIFEAGRCQVDGRPYLYALMEYADQDLAQLLQRRALTEDEAREMLMPTLAALGFLHQKKFVQGRVKPSNILVVGDQLKLASDTICRVGEAVDGVGPLSAYEAPEARETGRSAAGDIWALGVMICEALTRRQPMALHGGGNPVFPVDLSPAFRELTAWCLSRRPSDRPEVSELEASLRGERTVPIAIPAVEPSALADAAVADAVLSSSAVAAESATPVAAPVSETIAASTAPVVASPAPSTDNADQMAPPPVPPVPPVPPAAPAASVAPAAPQRGSIEVVVVPATSVPPSPGEPASAAETTRAAQAVTPSAAREAPPFAVTAPRVPAPAAAESSAAKPASPESYAARATANSASAPAPATAPPPAPTPKPATAQGAKATTGTASESAQYTPGRPQSKPNYLVGIASLAVVAVIVWGGMKLLGKPSSDAQSDPAVDVTASAAPDASPSVAANETASDAGAAGPADNTDGPAVARSPSQAAGARVASTGLASAGSGSAPRNASPASASATGSDESSVAINEVIPDVPNAARRTIRGRVRVSVRVIVEKDGTVFAALADNPGPSRYFERLAIDAAKKWTFAPADSDDQRIMLVRFTFERQGTTASATALR